MDPKTKYTKIIEAISTAARPIIFINGCTHGDERVGIEIIDHFKNYQPNTGTILTNIANEKALEKGVRYIEHDINRVGVGNQHGTYEEQVAFYLSFIAAQVDVFIDIHSTQSSIKNALIVDHLDEYTESLISIVCPEIVLVMRVTEGDVLLSSAKAGIAFEYGADDDPVAIQKIITDIHAITAAYGMEPALKRDTNITPKIFIVEGVFHKQSGDRLNSTIENLILVQKGQPIYRTAAGDVVYASESFYPILFSQHGYESVFGFVGRLLEDTHKQ
jgi:hypothetical protein